MIDLFWQAHDPTTLNRQGADVGPQYRSIILYENEAEKTAAERSKLEAQAHFKDPIVTEIVPLKDVLSGGEVSARFTIKPELSLQRSGDWAQTLRSLKKLSGKRTHDPAEAWSNRNPPNRFERLQVILDEEVAFEKRSPATSYFRDDAQTIISRPRRARI